VNLARRLHETGIRACADGQGVHIDWSPLSEPAGRLADACDAAKEAWQDLPPWIRDRIGKLALVLDTHPAGSGLRQIPVDLCAEDEWVPPHERWEMT